jgi:hypothetical protein
MECHECKHRKAVESGKYAVTPFRETPCGRCTLTDISMRTLEVDEGRPVYVGRTEGVDVPPEEAVPEPDESVDMMPVDVLVEVCAGILSLPQDVRDVVCMRVVGLSYRQIGRRQGITTAGAEARHERGMSLFPPLRELFSRKMVKRGMRRKARRTV